MVCVHGECVGVNPGPLSLVLQLDGKKRSAVCLYD